MIRDPTLRICRVNTKVWSPEVAFTYTPPIITSKSLSFYSAGIWMHRKVFME